MKRITGALTLAAVVLIFIFISFNCKIDPEISDDIELQCEECRDECYENHVSGSTSMIYCLNDCYSNYCDKIPYTVGGTVSGLAGTLVLTNNNSEQITIKSNGTFTFPTALYNNEKYVVSVVSRPDYQQCTITSGSGTVYRSNVDNISVVCEGGQYKVGGTVTGLNGTVIIQNNNGSNYTITSNGTFVLPQSFNTGDLYSVTVYLKQCASSCTIKNGSGTVNGGDITDIVIECDQTECTSPAVMVSAGTGNSIAIMDDGTAWAWGVNSSGQLGNGNTTNSRIPVQLNIPDIAGLSSGSNHFIVVKTDGSVWTCGGNSHGQLGSGNTTNSYSPVQVSGLAGITGVSAGYFYSLAVKSDGTVWAWGYNNYGQLGDDTTTDRSTPVQVGGLTGIIDVSAGDYYSIALKSDGTVWAWGDQIGSDNIAGSDTAVQVSGLTGIKAVSSGGSFGLALKDDGTVWAWGYNASGQLGDGTTIYRGTPVQVSGLTGIIAVSAGESHCLALKDDGTAWGWGYNFYGQLGDGTTTQRTSPVQINGLSSVSYISAGWNHSMAIKDDGTVWAWGYNYYAQLGEGTTTTRYSATGVPGL